jgi:hypothetical protein
VMESGPIEWTRAMQFAPGIMGRESE